ncbi:MAG: gephyrin-like molybdotransferase Glp [Pyrinomonadaceae bacterium]
MIDISKALKIIDRETGPLGSERVEISRSAGRILRENIIADTDLPPFDRSQMDGFAVVAADTEKAPVRLTIVGESAAGQGWHKTMKSGEAVRIMTGAPVPDGADSVQKVELTGETSAPLRSGGGVDQFVEILEPAEIGKFIVRKGSEIKKGATIFSVGDFITENMIAAIAAFGYAAVKVGKQPRVAILATGSEIVDIDKKPGRDQIRNSNSVMLDVLCRKFGAGTTVLPIVEDEISNLKMQISEAIGLNKSAIRSPQFQILILTGGVSVGKYDHTKAALAELGAEIFFDKVRLKPGKPAVFARLKETLIFGLPGNPVSAAVTFHLFVRKAILAMQGAATRDLKDGFALLGADAKAARERDTYLPSRLEPNKSGQLIAYPLKWQGSSDFVGFARADSMIFVARGETLAKGSAASIMYL